MNNEPVAWLHIQGNHFEASDRQLFDDEIERGWEQKPLYTHPVKELTPCEELREFQEQQNGVFSEHNACCYRHECRIVWNDWEKLRSNPAELTDEEMMKAEYEFMYWNRSLDKPLVEIAYELGVFKQAVAILRKAWD